MGIKLYFIFILICIYLNTIQCSTKRVDTEVLATRNSLAGGDFGAVDSLLLLKVNTWMK